MVDGASSSSNPVVLDILRKDYCFRTMAAISSDNGLSVIISGDVVSETAGLCCPDLHVAEQYIHESSGKYRKIDEKVERIH